eukprot:3008895-Rhodomonas_salina.2
MYPRPDWSRVFFPLHVPPDPLWRGRARAGGSTCASWGSGARQSSRSSSTSTSSSTASFRSKLCAAPPWSVSRSVSVSKKEDPGPDSVGAG